MMFFLMKSTFFTFLTEEPPLAEVSFSSGEFEFLREGFLRMDDLAGEFEVIMLLSGRTLTEAFLTS